MSEKIYLLFAASDMSRRDSNSLGNLCVADLGVLLLISNEFEERIDFGHLCTCQFRPIFGGSPPKEGCLILRPNFQTLLVPIKGDLYKTSFSTAFRVKRTPTVSVQNGLQYKPPCLRYATSFLEAWTQYVHTSKSDWNFCVISCYSYDYNGADLPLNRSTVHARLTL